MDHESFRARQRHLDLDGIAHLPLHVAYTDVGEGPPVLLLHGIPTWSFLYHDVIDALAGRHRVVAPDLLGHGWSDRRDRFDRSLPAQQQMIRRLLHALDLPRVILIGHDTGGGVALRMAIEDPELVDRLVLSNVVAYDSWPIDDMLALGNPHWRDRSAAKMRAFLLAGFEAGLSRPGRLTDAFREGIMAPYLDPEGRLSLIRNASALNTNHTTELADRHHTITAPTLLLWGVDDPWQPYADAQRLHAEIPDSRLVPLADTSHWSPQDAPDEWAHEVLEFTAPRSPGPE